MLWVGITGSMGSGKSAIADILRARGYSVLDADQIVHQVLGRDRDVVSEISKTFGQDIEGSDGAIDRRRLGQKVFGDTQKLAQLEAILHPKVRQWVATERHRLKSSGVAVAFYDVPLLFEKQMESQFDHILVVSSQEAIRMQRLQARTGLSETELRERWAKQLPPELKEQKASQVVRNDGDLKALERALDKALEALKIPLQPVT
jgi:dephospho-CoA kinase